MIKLVYPKKKYRSQKLVLIWDLKRTHIKSVKPINANFKIVRSQQQLDKLPTPIKSFLIVSIIGTH